MSSFKFGVVAHLVERSLSMREVRRSIRRCSTHQLFCPSALHRPFMQVVRLSREHALYSALAYLLTQALGDFAAPLAEMVWAMAHLAQVCVHWMSGVLIASSSASTSHCLHDSVLSSGQAQSDSLIGSAGGRQAFR